MALRLVENLDLQKIIDCFLYYLGQEKLSITRALFEKNMHEKLKNPDFLHDMQGLLQKGKIHQPHEEYRLIQQNLLSLFPGEPWKENVS